MKKTLLIMSFHLCFVLSSFSQYHYADSLQWDSVTNVIKEMMHSYNGKKVTLTNADMVGKWAKGERGAIYTKGITIRRWDYKFFKDGTYKENWKPWASGYPKRYTRGKWELKDNKLILTQTNNLFCSSSEPDIIEFIPVSKKLYWEILIEDPSWPLIFRFHKKRHFCIFK